MRFLQWCLPRLGLRWPGFRRARRTVCKRLGRRLSELGLEGLEEYRAYLDRAPAEWARLAEGGLLVVGAHEAPPGAEEAGLAPAARGLPVYRALA